MKAKPEFPETLTEAVKYFADMDTSIQFMAAIRWPDGKVACSKCHSSNAHYMASCQRWKCRDCKGQFSGKVGPVFEDHPIGLDRWLPAFWMLVNAKNGISSCEVARALGVTQKTAWFMLHRLRLALQNHSLEKLSGEVEIDETYVGGTASKMNTRQKRNKARGRGSVGKAIVMGILQRRGRVIAKAVPTAKRKTLLGHIHNNVEHGSAVYTDSLPSYDRLHSHYAHEAINHAVCYVKDNVHTNGLENFWSLLKRTIRGTYVSVEPFHLFRYLDEQAFRFNERKTTDAGRFLIGIVGVVGRRLTYLKLITDPGSHELPKAGTWQEKEPRRAMRRKPFGGMGWSPVTA